MFFHIYSNSIKSTVKMKITLFWTLLFPIGLATFMFFAFYGIMEKDEMLGVIPVAVVGTENDNASLYETISELSKEGDDQLLNVKYTSEKEAKKLLDNKKINGVIYLKDEKLMVKENGYEETVLQVVMDQYKQISHICTEVGKKDITKLAATVNELTADRDYFTEKSASDSDQNIYVNYFFAIFAMSCLFSSFTAVGKISSVQANSSPLGMRRSIAPTHKFIVLFAEYAAMVTVHFFVELLLMGYLILLGVDLGDKYPAMILLVFLGCCIGIAIGTIVGSIAKLSDGAKMGICVGTGMLLSVMADLCASGIKDLVAHKAPVLNKINPAVCISDGFYALRVFDDYNRFFENVILLLIMSVVLLIISYLMVRNNKYESI